MEWNYGMQVTGFVVIHNNIRHICVNVSALKECQNVLLTHPKTFQHELTLNSNSCM